MSSSTIGEIDQFYWERGYYIIGVDEVGRGPLAGPVTAAAVVLNHSNYPLGINDSKKVPAAKRLELSMAIRTFALGYAVVSRPAKRIDEIGILNATLEAMAQAVETLFNGLRGLLQDNVKKIVLVDGVDRIPKIAFEQTPLVRGDARSLSIAAASIVAKVHRDGIMKHLSNTYPKYLWNKNSGYGTGDHIRALRRHGPTPEHRRRFITNLLKGE